MSNENQFRDEQEMVSDPNFPEPKCGVCGVPWAGHMGIMGLCAEFAKLRKERDEARREICELSSIDSGELDLYASNKEAKRRGWDCYDEEADHNNESFKKGRMK